MGMLSKRGKGSDLPSNTQAPSRSFGYPYGPNRQAGESNGAFSARLATNERTCFRCHRVCADGAAATACENSHANDD